MRLVVVGGTPGVGGGNSAISGNSSRIGCLDAAHELWLWHPAAVDVSSIDDVDGVVISRLRKRTT